VSLFILDTDTLTLYERMHPSVMRSVFKHFSDEIHLTTITIEEQLGGWFTLLRAARTPTQVETAHVRLATTIRLLMGWDTSPFTVAAVMWFQDLLRRRLNVGGNDLRIASIALEVGATVVTRNLRDFRRVPGLSCEDWSV
jgi:tRNA(fMet)-specific endonuclease VapC